MELPVAELWEIELRQKRNSTWVAYGLSSIQALFGDNRGFVFRCVLLRLLKIGCRYDKIAYCVIGDDPTEHYDDYDDALEESNLRWMKAKLGE